MDQNGSWLSIIDYAKLKKISISTIRRHIKSEKVFSKLSEGKYLIFVDQKDRSNCIQREELKEKLEIELLKSNLRKLEEENSDLRMLVTLYEGKKHIQQQNEIPRMPLL